MQGVQGVQGGLGLGFRVEGLGLDLRFMVWGLGFKVQGSWFRV